MDWLTWATYIAIFLVVWHEMHRFPETNRSFYKLQEKIEELESDKQDLEQKVEYLDTQLDSLIEQVNRLVDPA
ncbi:hypothetical protein CJF42_25750 [Pseudoalteromonas sp. NBT06-2]|uniref:hypothetical protein n=1 Tax=Pseudoalteromonas sp. NBT06-2 TaxID=2025950 RepID=UPI000BA54DD3|nr:hypothetical protein [Pseudoalteromonas sp. NBT06-2]PAJ71602.1 hypothetical protein CJF42_25750 [Pseudoalteromonas sp. NBT06-2]